jgi:glutamate synthase domain-containing protein 1
LKPYSTFTLAFIAEVNINADLCCRVGMVFMPNDDALEAQAKAITEEVVAAEGLTLLGWRQVPVSPEVVGRFAKATQPRIWQVCERQQCVLHTWSLWTSSAGQLQ